MKTTRLIVSEKPAHTIKTDLLVYCLIEEKHKVPSCDPYIKTTVQRAYDLGDFCAQFSEQLLTYPQLTSDNDNAHAKRILIIGMGELKADADPVDFFDILRKTGGNIAKVCEKIKADSLTVCVPDIPDIGFEKTAQFLTEGIYLGDYRFAKYKKIKTEKPEYTGLKTLNFASGVSVSAIRKGARKGLNAANAACEARDMANEPGNGWTSAEFADFAKSLSKKYGFKYTCLEKKDLVRLGMGGILAVNQGSAIPPRMVIVEYRSSADADTLLLVGKGITFDSGGISIKPGLGMEEMKYDMCGGAAVLCAMQTVGEETPDLNIVAIVPATDNMSGSHAVRPGDIIKHFNGLTSEIVNTDAEGRMILGDALSYGVQTYTPDAVIDIATLTGAVIIGLGHHHSGLMTNNETLAGKVIKAGKHAGEPVWQLPLTDEYKEQIKSDVADVKNIGGKPGGSITAAAYLSNFVGQTPWVHLDIAGTAWDFTEKSYIPKGPSGIGVRTFIDLIRNWKKGMLK
ncbi:MAG: leucyl aminopeptidase [Proteobacteria bacterium]|nr:leucyl aminopeptidase [Pseudomonadota bacterium]MBU1389531.1 leucyl aminopeptidase [Pseudomonadota bacterium]MBU1544395.1 leucyl aminopeptidase [Pseudomonadota bacterium]MBU2430195.1 leucyl aminopeptidase [Pseudomonadota bacterium]MBU2481929.1 leucyl aminopeptidase [Pseudomonadota bacterium]